MKTRPVVIAVLVVTLLAVVLVGPLLVPIPALESVVPPLDLADPDSRFAEIDGLRVHYKLEGFGEPALVLLHGFGASVFSWREVMRPLGQLGTAIAFDRPGFGLTDRPLASLWRGQNPYSLEAQADLTVALLDELGFQKAVLVGNSAGGTVAMLTALRYPERVQALVLVSPAVSGHGVPEWSRTLMQTPQVQRLGPLLVRYIGVQGEAILRSAWHDPTHITPEILAGYRLPLQAIDWDRALWELTLASHPLDLESRIGEIRVPTLVIAGDDDRIVPTQQSVQLASRLPRAQLVVQPSCGHVPQEECPTGFVQAIYSFLDGLRRSR